MSSPGHGHRECQSERSCIQCSIKWLRERTSLRGLDCLYCCPVLTIRFSSSVDVCSSCSLNSLVHLFSFVASQEASGNQHCNSFA